MELVEVVVSGPGASPPTTRLRIAPSDLFVGLRAALLECPAFATYTSYQFEFEGTLCQEYDQIGTERKELKMVEIPYTFATIRDHVQRFQDLLRHPPKNLSIDAWINGLVEDSKPSESESVLNTAFSLDQATQSECDPFDSATTRSSLSLCRSAHDPPRSPQRLQGDLLYLDIQIAEQQLISITGTQSGFFINKTRKDHFDPSAKARAAHRSFTLAALLCKCSQAFRNEFAALMAGNSPLHPLMQAPMPISSCGRNCYGAVEPPQSAPLRFDAVKSERNWNDELLAWNAPETAGAETALTRFGNQYKTYADFVNCAIAGAVSIVQGEIAPLNVNEPKSSHVYLHDNIFFSVALDSRGFYADQGGDRTAHKFASHDLHAAHLVSRILLSETGDSQLHTLMSAVVDYVGVRLICQAIIPGILNGGGSTLLFGSIDQGAEAVDFPAIPAAHIYKTDNEFFTEQTEHLAQRLHWSKSNVLDSQGNVLESVALPMDCKGLSTSDGRTYLMDLVRITPRDLNYPNSISSVLRLELVNQWCHDRAMDEVLKAKGKEPESNGIVDDGRVEDANKSCFVAVADVESAAAAIKFNINALTQYRVVDEHSEDLQIIEKISKSIIDEAIPALISDMKSLSISCIDSRSMSGLFHSHGVNLRYLGRVFTTIIETLLDTQPELCQMLATNVYREILVRSCKHLLSGELRVLGSSAPLSPCIVAFLNNAVQTPLKTKNAFSTRLFAEMKSRFSFSPDKRVQCIPAPMAILTGICQTVGLQIARRTYDFSESGAGVVLGDILDLKPVVKYHLPDSIDTSSAFATARSKIARDDQQAAHDILSQLVQILCSVTGAVHPDVAEAFSMLSLISYRRGDTLAAIDQSYRVIIALERLYGAVNSELARAVSQHALFLMCGGFHQRAYRYALKAKQIFELLGGPSHPDTATTLLNIGVILMESGKPSEALEVQLDGIARLEEAIGKDAKHVHLVTAYHAIAFSFAVLRQFREAIQYEQRSRAIARSLGSEGLVNQCNSFLAMFTKGAVLAAKNDPQQITIKPTAAALAWIALPHVSKASAFSPIKEMIYFSNENLEQLQKAAASLQAEANSLENSSEEAAPESNTLKEKIHADMVAVESANRNNC